MNKPARPAIYDDIIALPENLVGEILNGELHTHPRPAPRHARAYSALGGTLWNTFDHGMGGAGGWWTRTRAPWKRTGWVKTATGCCWKPPMKTTR